MRGFYFQTDFSAGVLDPKLLGRIDLQQYPKGMLQADNVTVLPHGGVKRRPGMRMLVELTKEMRILQFSVSTLNDYIVLLGDQEIRIYGADDYVLKQTITTYFDHTEPDPVEIDLPYTLNDLPVIDYTQSADTMILVHPDHAPLRLLREDPEPTPTFRLDLVPLKHIPVFEFPNSTLDPVDERQRIAFLDFQEKDTFRLTLEAQTSQRVNYSSDTTEMAASIQRVLRLLPNTESDFFDAEGIVVSYDPDSIPGEPAFFVDFGGEDGAKDWDLIGWNNNSETGDITVDEVLKGGSKDEPVWSTERGWPRSVVFHEGRLVFGGSKGRPATIWFSRIQQFFDFALGEALEDDGIEQVIHTDQVNAITHLFSARNLEIFTTGGEFYVSTKPITAASFAVPLQSRFGTNGVKPVNLDGATLFIDRANRALRQFLYTYTEDAYQANEVSILAQSIITNPRSLAAVAQQDGDYCYVVNQDGTVAVLTTNRYQQIAAWSRFTLRPQDVIFWVQAIGSKVYAMTRRLTGLSIRYFLEVWDEDVLTDGAVVLSRTSTKTWTDALLERFRGEQVWLRLLNEDGVWEVLNGPITVQDSATPTITTEIAGTKLEVGYEVLVTIVPMPPTVQIGLGQNIHRLRRISDLTLVLNDVRGLTLNGWKVEPKALGFQVENVEGDVSDSGTIRMKLLGGYSLDPRITLMQRQPYPLSIYSMLAEVSGGGA